MEDNGPQVSLAISIIVTPLDMLTAKSLKIYFLNARGFLIVLSNFNYVLINLQTLRTVNLLFIKL